MVNVYVVPDPTAPPNVVCVGGDTHGSHVLTQAWSTTSGIVDSSLLDISASPAPATTQTLLVESKDRMKLPAPFARWMSSIPPKAESSSRVFVGAPVQPAAPG